MASRIPEIRLVDSTLSDSSDAHIPPSPPPSPSSHLRMATQTDISSNEGSLVLEGTVEGPSNQDGSIMQLPITDVDPTPVSQEVTLRERTAEGNEKKKASWLRRRREPLLGNWSPTLTLENSGSVARDHLASERTFLAYVRTSLTISSTGVGKSTYVDLDVPR